MGYYTCSLKEVHMDFSSSDLVPSQGKWTGLLGCSSPNHSWMTVKNSVWCSFLPPKKEKKEKKKKFQIFKKKIEKYFPTKKFK